ncbi:MAG: sensory box histidine kinase/response regulator [Myxococcaceae bacterium]|nr:sensory box histidine kinase/response regulator [Myxococcaceae bacterium]
MVGRGEKGFDEGLYRAVFDASARPMWLYEQDTLALIAVNDAACVLYGRAREELLSMNVTDLSAGMAADALGRLVEQLRRPAGAAPSGRCEIWQRGKTGAMVLLDVQITALLSAGRRIGHAAITELTDAEAAHRRFRLLVERSGDGITITNAETRALEYVSPSAAAILGFSADELTGVPAERDVDPASIAAWTRPAEGESTVSIFRNRHADGTWRSIEALTTNLIHEPAVRGIVTRFRDVTERKESEQAVLEAQHRLEYVLSATSAITYASRASDDFGATFISANAKAVTGYDSSEFIDTPTFWLDHIHPDDRAGVDEALRLLLEKGEHSFQYRFRHADGRFRWMQDVPRVVFDAKGRPAEIVGYWIDVTERIQAEYTLRGSEANFRMLIEKAPGAIFVHRAGPLVYVNSAAVKMLGYDDASELVGRPIIDLVHAEDRDAIRVRMGRTIREGASPLMEARLLRRDGGSVAAEAEAVLLDFGGEPSSVVLARDVTERREMFARVAAADRMRSVGTLAAGVAHEINNPLAYVISNLALLAAEVPHLRPDGTGGRLSSGDVERLVRDSQEGAARVSGIVRDLLSLSRADDEASGPVDIRSVVDSCLKIAHSEMRHRARVVTDIGAALPPALANASRLAQVLLNLLVNAAHAIVVGDIAANEIRVRAGASSDGENVWIEVEDTGVGMSPSLMERIFDPFFTTKPIGVGTGLGLSISHHIVRSMGGEISVISTPRVGSCFRITLPATDPISTSAERPVTAGDSLVATRRVLVIDDERALVMSLRLLLTPDYDVVAVTRARSALDLLVGGERFDAILCDLMMPEMSGIELHDELARLAPECVGRLVYMTGGAFTDEARAFLGTFGKSAIGKPFSEKDVRHALDAVISTG